MSSSLFRARCFIRTVRGFKTSSRLRDAKLEPAAPGSKPPETPKSQQYIGDIHYVSDFEKKILVFARKYPSVKDVPNQISTEIMQNSMSKARIRLANMMMFATLMVCLGIVINGNLKKSDKMEEMKLQHDEFRKQITAEFKESAKHDKK